ncbi:MAG: signal transduction histidine kinase [Bacteroidetes bacterium]|jgi:signal transduction histidine kinase|nr:signal transduction histidine kinase [Bacteroidota bacterium]
MFSQKKPRSKQEVLAAIRKEKAAHPEPSPADTVRLKLLCKLSTLPEMQGTDSMLLLAEEALELALTIRTSPGYEEPAIKKNTEYWIGECYDLVGDYQYARENYAAAIDHYIGAQTVWAKQGNDEHWATSTSKIGSVYADRADYSKALEYQFQSLKMTEKLGLEKNVSVNLGNIGITYALQEQNEKALEYFNASLKIAEKLGNKQSVGVKLGNIGLIYSNMNEFEKAQEYYERSLQIAEEEGDEEGVATKLLNMGVVYYKMAGQVKSADEPGSPDVLKRSETYLLRALKMFEQQDNQQAISQTLLHIGQLERKQKKQAEAAAHLKQSVDIAEKIGSMADVQNAAEELSDLYSETGKHELALRYYKKYVEAYDSIYSEEHTAQQVRTEMNYEYEKETALQAAEHEKEVALLEAEHKNKRNVVLLASLIVLVLLVAAFVYYNIRKNLRVKEEYTRQLLTGQEKERQRISKELHDGVGQHILFLRNQLVKLENESLIASADETLEEVRSISKNLYPNQLEKYGLIAAVDAMIKKLGESSGIFASHDLEAFKRELSAEQQINIYRLIQECVTNAVKHASATALRITATEAGRNIELVIQDDGKGFDKQKLKQAAQKSFGVLNLEERVRLLKGRSALETSPGNGTKWTFIIPIQET